MVTPTLKVILKIVKRLEGFSTYYPREVLKTKLAANSFPLAVHPEDKMICFDEDLYNLMNTGFHVGEYLDSDELKTFMSNNPEYTGTEEQSYAFCEALEKHYTSLWFESYDSSRIHWGSKTAN